MNLIHYLDQLQELINTPSLDLVQINEILDTLRTEFANQPEQSNNELSFTTPDNLKLTLINPKTIGITTAQSYLGNNTEFTITLLVDSWRTHPC